MKTQFKKAILIFVTVIFSFPIQAIAAPTLSPYPAPGGNSASMTGNDPGNAGGVTWSLGGFNPAAYGQLYYGVGDYDNNGNFLPGAPNLSMDFGGYYPMSFDSARSNLSGGVAVYDGSVGFYSFNYGQIYIPGEFILTVTNPSDASLALTAVSAIPGLPSELGAVLNVTGDFNANWQFLAQFPGQDGYTPSLDTYNSGSYQTDANAQEYTSVGGAFYYTDPTSNVPEPSVPALLGISILALCFVRRKGGNN